MASKILQQLSTAGPIELKGENILLQISPEIRNQKQPRPSDVRLLLRTAQLNGQEYQFPNHGHPDNELSTVPFNGENAIVIMPAGDTPRRQLFSAQQIIDRFKRSGLDRVTPEFMEKEVIRGGLSKKFAAQAYGPAPFTSQAARFVDVDIPGNNGPETIHPEITESYAVGMRAPVEEEAFLVVFTGRPEDLFIKAGNAASAYLSTMEKAIPVNLEGSNTAAENLDGLGYLAKGIVLAVDAAGGDIKPVRLESAKDIFNLARLPVVLLDKDERVIAQYKPVAPAPR